MGKIRIVLADDHTLVRAGIRSLLESMQDVEVVAEAVNGLEALELTRKHRPELVLLDIGMAEMDGLQALLAIKAEMPETKAIMLSMHSTSDIVQRALQAGASAYLVKDAAATELELAVRAVSRDEVYLSPAVSREIVASYVQRGRDERGPIDELTPRQHEVLLLIADGKNTKEIARHLNLSAKTVEAHRAQIMERMGVHNVANLIIEALRKGLISYKAK